MKKHSSRVILHLASLLAMYIFLDMGIELPGYICVALVFLSLPLAMIRDVSWKTYLISLGLIFVYFGILEANGHDARGMVYLSLAVIYLVPYGVGRLKTWLTLRKVDREMEEE